MLCTAQDCSAEQKQWLLTSADHIADKDKQKDPTFFPNLLFTKDALRMLCDSVPLKFFADKSEESQTLSPKV